MIDTHKELEYIDAVQASFENSIVAVTDILPDDKALELAKFAPDQGRHKVYLDLGMMAKFNDAIDPITNTRMVVNNLITSRLGSMSTFASIYAQRPDVIRAGETMPHYDGFSIALSTSVNLDDDGQPVTVYGYRLADADAPYRDIVNAYKQIRLNLGSLNYDQVAVKTGDAVVIGRGVLHFSHASPDRKSISNRTRGLIRI